MPFCIVQEGKEKKRWSRGVVKALCLHLQGFCQAKWVLEPDKHWQEPASGDDGEAGRRKPWPKQCLVNMGFMWGQNVFNQAGMLRAQMAFNGFHTCSPTHWLQQEAGAGWSALCTFADQALQAPHQKRSPVTQQVRAAYARGSISFTGTCLK